MRNSRYDEAFYQDQMQGSLQSALFYASLLSNYISIESVADFGCGRGMWLKAFKEFGARRLVGFDGHWNNQNNMIDQSIEFRPIDLERLAANSNERFDLSVSVEVAEHLQPSSSENFINNLTTLSDVVLFGAAFIGQGGTNHINEQKNSYWAHIFLSKEFAPYDLFRSKFWGKDEIEFWYQQNTFLYVRKNSSIEEKLSTLNCKPMENINFMDAIHPSMHQRNIRALEKARKSGILKFFGK